MSRRVCACGCLRLIEKGRPSGARYRLDCREKMMAERVMPTGPETKPNYANMLLNANCMSTETRYDWNELSARMARERWRECSEPIFKNQ